MEQVINRQKYTNLQYKILQNILQKQYYKSSLHVKNLSTE